MQHDPLPLSRVMVSDFLCALSANKYQIEFLEFTISDYVTKNIIFMVRIVLKCVSTLLLSLLEQR